MKKLRVNFVIFAVAFLVCLTFSTNSANGQSTTSQGLESCGGVNFTFVLTEIPGQNGKKQQVEVRAENTNKFRVHVSFKFRATSNEGGNYTPPASANSYNAGTSGRVDTFVPFGEENLNRNTYPKIAQIGLFDVDIRNVENLGNTAGAYSRGAKIGGACGGKMKTVSSCSKATEEQVKELSQAINRGDLAAVKDLIDNKGVDVNATLGIASTTGKEKITPVMEAILRWTFYEVDPPNPEIVAFLLERGADFRVKQGGETLLEKTNYAVYTLNSWKEEARKQGKVKYENMTKSFPEWISATEQIVALLEQYQSGNQVIKRSPCSQQ